MPNDSRIDYLEFPARNLDGGTLAKDIFSFPGGRRFHFTDPNGNELAAWSDR
jgi:predicted enzyme related to lactoylglutathione lyase